MIWLERMLREHWYFTSGRIKMCSVLKPNVADASITGFIYQVCFPSKEYTLFPFSVLLKMLFWFRYPILNQIWDANRPFKNVAPRFLQCLCTNILFIFEDHICYLGDWCFSFEQLVFYILWIMAIKNIL